MTSSLEPGVTSATRTSLDELKRLLQVDESIDSDDPLWLRFASIEIELTAAESSEARAAPDNVLSDLVRLKLIELNRMLTDIARDALGYYALVDEPPGSNEPPLGGDRAQRIRSAFLAAKLGDELEVMRLRKGLFEFIEDRLR